MNKGKSMINTVVYSTVLKGFAVSKRIDKVLAVYKATFCQGLLGCVAYHSLLMSEG